MKIGREQKRVHIEIEGKELEQVRHFKYLGSLLAEDVNCETEIRARVAMAKETFKPHNSLFTASLELQLKKRLMKCFVWGVFLYGSETWTLRKEDRKRIDALEMWLWRKSENIKWSDSVTNEEVLQRVGEVRRLGETIKLRKKRWIGHILRHDGLLKDVLEGRMNGKRPRGRKRVMLMHDIRDGRNYFTM
ncbi:uncharacterized protein [Apostichopus japonicus]|uniref:uncharacterized protein n=1 Tax=Stichopus japonicus TaxID=307972 RepID=UPI003AB429A2